MTINHDVEHSKIVDHLRAALASAEAMKRPTLVYMISLSLDEALMRDQDKMETRPELPGRR